MSVKCCLDLAAAVRRARGSAAVIDGTQPFARAREEHLRGVPSRSTLLRGVLCRDGDGFVQEREASPARGLPPVRVLRLDRLRRLPDPRRLRRARACRGRDLRRRGLRPARHERAVPPRDLAPRAPTLDAAPRPLDDLRDDRRYLHARGAARAEGLARGRGPGRAVGRRARGRGLQARLDRRAEVAARGDLRRARAGVGRRLRRAPPPRSDGWAWPVSQPAERCTSQAR